VVGVGLSFSILSDSGAFFFMRPETREQAIARLRRRYDHDERLLRRRGYDPDEIEAGRADKILKKERFGISNP